MKSSFDPLVSVLRHQAGGASPTVRPPGVTLCHTELHIACDVTTDVTTNGQVVVRVLSNIPYVQVRRAHCAVPRILTSSPVPREEFHRSGRVEGGA